MGKLYDKLTQYGKSDFYPYHMPGHKRNMQGRDFALFYDIDITEIDGFDNLHEPQEILKELALRMNRLYGADETFLLVNGSTCGILGAISAVTDYGDRILIARNCHKSVYHAAYLRELKLSYIFPDVQEEFDIPLGVTPDQVKEELQKQKDIKAVVITSPTYEGIVSDIKEIAEIVHSYGIPLIVDEAHGAHFCLGGALPESAVTCGADVVIHSLHKTLPSPTQTALLHVKGKLADRDRIARYLRIYQSSSPSYPLMAGMELCADLVETEGKELLSKMRQHWDAMLQSLKQCKVLKILTREDVLQSGMKEFDMGKLVISTASSSWSGQQLYEALLHRYHLQMEMATETYVLAMFTILDSEEGFVRLTEALLAIDSKLQQEAFSQDRPDAFRETVAHKNFRQHTFLQPDAKCNITQALDAETKWVALSNAQGEAAADFINLYPPGIPVVVPGEGYTKELVEMILDWHDKQLHVQGIDKELRVPVVNNRFQEKEKGENNA